MFWRLSLERARPRVARARVGSSSGAGEVPSALESARLRCAAGSRSFRTAGLGSALGSCCHGCQVMTAREAYEAASVAWAGPTHNFIEELIAVAEEAQRVIELVSGDDDAWFFVPLKEKLRALDAIVALEA